MLDETFFQTHNSRIIVRDYYGEPSREAFDLRLLTDKFWQQAQAKKNAVNLKRYDLKPFDRDDIEDKTPRAISLQYTPYFEDRFNRLSDWEPIIRPEEKTFRDGRLSELNTRLSDLQAKLADEDNEREIADLTVQIGDLQAKIKRMNAGGLGWCEAVPDGFGDGTSTLYDPLNEPYVPRERLSKFWIGRDTPYCLRLYFSKPDEEQSDWEFFIEWGVYRILFSIDRVQFIRLSDKLSPAAVEAKEKQLNELLDLGRITRQDTLWKAEQKRAIADIKAKAKEEDRNTENDLTDAELASIKAIEKAIDDRWDAKKRRTGAQEKTIDDLRRELYRETRTVEFGQNFETFFNVPLVLSILPQARGYLTLQLEGADAWTYEEADILKGETPGTLWSETKLRHKINGGAYKLQIGVLDPRRLGTLAIPFVAPFDVTGVEWIFNGYWDGQDNTDAPDPLGLRPKVTFAVNPVNDGSIAALRGQTAQVLITLEPGAMPPPVRGKRLLQARALPFLYSASVFAPAGERTGTDAVAWDSRDHEIDGIAPIVDIKPAWDDQGRKSCIIELRAAALDELGTTQLGELPDLAVRVCDAYIDACEDTDAPWLARGIISQPELKAALDAGPEALASASSVVSFTLSDRSAVLREAMQAKPVGDSQYLGEYFRTVLACRGERESEYGSIDPQAGRVMRPARPGEAPAIVPSQDTTYESWLQNLLELHGIVPTGVLGGGVLRLKWRGDADGGFWTVEPDDTNLLTIDGVVVDWRSDGSGAGDGRYHLRESVDLPDDDSDIFNVFPIEGAIDPVTKEPIKRIVTVYESLRKRDDLRFIGHPRPYKTIKETSLKTVDDVLRFGRLIAQLKCRSKKFRRLTLPFVREIEPFTQTLADGLRVELVKLQSASIENDEMKFLARRLV